MPPLEQNDLPHKMLWWRVAGTTKHGQPRVSSASRTEVRCRWTDTKRDALKPDKSLKAVDATIAVDRALNVGDIVWRGGLVNLTPGLVGTGTGTEPGEMPASGFMQVVQDKSAADVRGRETRYEYGLIRWGDAAPTV